MEVLIYISFGIEIDNEQWRQFLVKIVFNPESILNSDNIDVLKWDYRTEG